MDPIALTTVFATLFVIVDPIALTPVFVALTKGADAAHRRALALRACVIAAVLLTLFGLIGDALLSSVGISIPAFRIAGGILLFLTALDMLFERRSQRRKGQAHASSDPSVFPLATPLIAGPGAIATMILLVGQTDGLAGTLIVLLVMLAVVTLVFLAFLMAGSIERALGDTGTNVVTRLLGMLLAALSVQFVLDGLAGAGVFTPAG